MVDNQKLPWVYSKGEEQNVFDWTRAAEIIKDRDIKNASAGLAEDWDMTNGQILVNGKPKGKNKSNIFLGSTWATPVLVIGDEIIPCYRLESDTPGWNSITHWPEEALAILGFNSIDVYEVDC